jgi:hypothetical protein
MPHFWTNDYIFELLQRYCLHVMNLEEVMHKGWFDMIQFHWPTLWKIKIIEVNGNSLLEFVCNGNEFRDMHLLKFIIMVRNSTSLLLVSKMKLSMHMCQSFLSWCNMFVYGTTLEVYGCHSKCGTSSPTTWRGSSSL